MGTDLMGLIDQLRSTLGKMEVALGAIADAIVWTDKDCHIQWCNAAFDRLVNCEHILVLGEKLNHLLPLWQAGQAVACSAYPDARILAGRYEGGEYELQRGGCALALEISGSCVEMANGERSAVLVIRDMTPARRLEAERRRLENELISLVSHELRTPLTSLLGALDLLGTGQLGSLTPRGRQVLAIAVTNTERLARLVNDILDLERLQANQFTIQKVRCSAARLLVQAAEALQAQAEQNEIALVVESCEAEVLADPDRILQALINLLNNAIKFSPPKGTIRLAAHVQSDHLQIQVQDQGRGIPAEKLRLIFERFQQVDASDSRQKGGSGLGLAICRDIVERHGGRIWVESVPGAGSTFYLTLPLLHYG
ncbi:PAS domain-containing sensor histidine kinase [Gloeobacter kilaueensis]|uniref:histidine kinase n=1 Tax=Gloeobacter kilaueensis (strain ATCC BAA-2537 / CCAP 1431/1 / ULC 316 / JS1) TaxID=1183438 RepID=U5QJG8_GLOK1|nr:ATP-binding protein [Gloeobacter kilaueensis]AGY59132.1 multi-sensor signal transduction histidine kinase [Gloeobacter kilaueensis JS1]